jgi:hypothetical protein
VARLILGHDRVAQQPDDLDLSFDAQISSIREGGFAYPAHPHNRKRSCPVESGVKPEKSD